MIRAAALLAIAACSRPAPPPPDWTVKILPVDERIYKLDDEIGFESWNLGLDIAGPGSDAGADEVSFEYTAGARLVDTRTLTRHALQVYLPQADPPSFSLRNLQVQMPAALEVDAVRIRALRHGRVRADRTVPLVRYQQKNRFRLPVRGCWFVSSGHDFGLEHRRWYTRSHFAWDFVRVDNNGAPHGPRAELTDYLSFGQPVVAPADGRVVVASDEHPDNRPGAVGDRLEANFLLLDHGDGEYTKLAHLAQGSLTVARGERVRAGQVLAEVGNSGLSDAPHLHVHFQGLVTEGGVITEEPPLPARFSDYWTTSNAGARVWTASGRPRRGEFVCAE